MAVPNITNTDDIEIKVAFNSGINTSAETLITVASDDVVKIDSKTKYQFQTDVEKKDSYEISETVNTSAVGLSIVSNWADFEKKNGRKTNNTSQQRFFTGAVGMDFASQTVQDITWGRA